MKDNPLATEKEDPLFLDEPLDAPPAQREPASLIDLFPSEDELAPSVLADEPIDWRRMNTLDSRAADPAPGLPGASRRRYGFALALIVVAAILGFVIVSKLLR